MLASRESQHLAERLIRETVVKEGVVRDQLTIHSDRGPSMRSQTVAQLLATLGITKSHSRPHVSDDNPFSESQFKTMKYQPEFPDRFTSMEHGLEFCGKFIHWQNHEHHHWGLGLLTPAMVHCGQAAAVLAARQTVLTAAYAAHPERFVGARRVRWRCQAKSGSTLRPMGWNPVCYNYRATLISYRSCLKPIDTFRRVLKLVGSAWIFRFGVVSEGGGRQQNHRPDLAHNPWGGARVGSHRSPILRPGRLSS